MSNHYTIGIDIGGTKTAIVVGDSSLPLSDTSHIDTNNIDTDNNPKPPKIVKRISFPSETQKGVEYLLSKIFQTIEGIVTNYTVETIGISCGGPLDSKRGIVLSPPNLPGWDNIPIVEMIEKRFNIKTSLKNDANAGALAEWLYGAGKGFKNIIFLTFGTGLGAGLILDGKLYEGTTDTAGEVGHIRLAETGPVGYGKEGSFEGFCSGTGIVNLAKKLKKTNTYQSSILKEKNITAKEVFEAAKEGDMLAKEVVMTSARYLGYGLSILIDILNPERIIIGSIFTRNEQLLRKEMEKIIAQEALTIASKGCSIVSSQLGEHIGDYASLAVAEYIGE